MSDTQERLDKAARYAHNRAVFGCEEKTEAAKPLLDEDFGFMEEPNDERTT